MTFIDNIQQTYKRGDMVIKLIFVNVAIFLAVSVLSVVFKLFNLSYFDYTSWFSVPSNLDALATHFWTPITYMFYHEQFFHILFNLLVLFWFGKIFLTFYSEKQLLSLYFIGGLLGAAAYVLAYNVFPYYTLHQSVMMGASGAIIAILVAAAVRVPNMEMHLLLLGRVKLKWIAIATVVISFFSLTGKNAGGEIAHLGGALAGYLFVTLERKGRDITNPINKIIDFLVNIIRPRPKPRQKAKVYHSQKMSDAEYNQHKANNEKEIDKILDKIKTSGYESLTTEEKKRLFEQKR